MVLSISFQTFCTGIYNCRRLLKIQYVIAIHPTIWRTNFYDFRFKWTATVAIGIHPTKAWLSLLVNLKNAIWILEERYAIKFCFKLGKKCHRMSVMECFRLLLEHLPRIEHQFLSGMRDSRKAGSLWGIMRGVGVVRKSENQSWLAKRLELGFLCWGFNGVQQEIPSEENRTFQIGSVAFPPGQFTSLQLHPCQRLFDQYGYQDCSSASL